ncbi:CRISPR-associated protein Cas5 [Clostridium beijerinckii]|uniref:CRISPR-associated protein Cas5 n=1 Tax=Clostridium beijerinckii TaxID=1520 RepID=UPI00047BB0C2|nr:CRISPR-associated protein Cas5 [Clostridium beijerinckii]
MRVIRFRVEGIFNSFRIPFFRTYQKSFLAPPKTTIIGMLTNIMGKSEQFYYTLLEEDMIKVSVVINSIKGKAKDLWSYKSFESKSDMHGRSIIRRDKLYNAKYTIYLMIENEELSKEIYDSLICPKSIPALGLDDEIIKIFDVDDSLTIDINKFHIINSVFMDKGYNYEVKISDSDNYIELPTSNITPLKYKIIIDKDFRLARKNMDEYKQVEYLNCCIELKDVESYKCENNNVVFY